ncbi:MAG: WYL domain-containing protein, partial [Chromatiaceae bacterium]
GELDAHFTASYGIFAGEPTGMAVLRFDAHRARWVAKERWHRDQQGCLLADGSYELKVPYSSPLELIMDVLKYGPDVEVVAPEELRTAVAQRLRAGADRYGSRGSCAQRSLSPSPSGRGPG